MALAPFFTREGTLIVNVKEARELREVLESPFAPSCYVLVQVACHLLKSEQLQSIGATALLMVIARVGEEELLGFRLHCS